MKAIITELWETGIDIVTTENNNSISSITDLQKCNNVLIGEKSVYGTDILINDLLIQVSFRTVMHPVGCGKLRICVINQIN